MSGLPWTKWPDERIARLRELEAQGLPIREIGRRLGFAPTTIRRQLISCGAQRSVPRPSFTKSPVENVPLRRPKGVSTLPPLASLRDE